MYVLKVVGGIATSGLLGNSATWIGSSSFFKEQIPKSSLQEFPLS